MYKQKEKEVGKKTVEKTRIENIPTSVIIINVFVYYLRAVAVAIIKSALENETKGKN